MRRVTKGPVVVLTCDPDLVRAFWLYEYCSEALDTEASRYPNISSIAEILGLNVRVNNVPIPLDCADGFNEAYYGRPEMLLRPEARLACSAWSFVDEDATRRFEDHLRKDLNTGAWGEKYGHLRSVPQFEGSLRLIVSAP